MAKMSSSDIQGDERPEFSYETDHEALRGNRDYLAVLKTLAVLQAQKIQAVKDLEVLTEAKLDALKDPLAFIDKLQRGEDLGLPGKQVVAKQQPVDWSKYGLASLNSRQAIVASSSPAAAAAPRPAANGSAYTTRDKEKTVTRSGSQDIQSQVRPGFQ